MGAERERQRIAVLREYHLLDSPPAAELDAVVRVAAAVAGVPRAALNLLDDVKQVQLTAVGGAAQTCARGDSMCAVRLERGEFVHLRDAREEPDYRDNPWVTGRLGRIVFYASAPLISPGGFVMGTLCVFDDRPRQLTPGQIDRLRDLAGVMVAFFERRREARLSAHLNETIRLREEWTRTVLDSIDEAVIAIGTDGRVSLFNRAARETHAADVDLEASMAGAAARYRLYEPDGRTPIADDEVPLVAVMRTGEPLAGREMVIREPGREPRTVLANAAPLRDGAGSVNGAVVALHDVTAEHVRQRLLQEAHQRLSVANAELRRSNADLSNFAGAVSHDLVAPLAAVGGYLDLLGDELRGDELRGDELRGAELLGEPGEGAGARVAGWVSAASEAVGRMRDLIDALLDYARAGNAPVRAVRVPLGEVIGPVLRDLDGEIAATGACVSVPAVLPEVTGDPVLIRQLLQNLLGNAIRYRDPARPCRVRVSVEGTTVRIADNGVGIPADRREEVFDMFTRLGERPGAGHGIGLSSCLRIVERHGGTITIEDTPGGGTTVAFALPLR